LLDGNSGTIWVDNHCHGEVDIKDLDVITEDGKLKLVEYQNRRPPYTLTECNFKFIEDFKEEIKNFVAAVNREDESYTFSCFRN